MERLSDEVTKGLSQRWIEGEWDTSDDEESNILDFIDAIARKAEQEILRQVVEELSGFVEMLKYAPEMHGDIQADPPKTHKFLGVIEDLKKQTEEEG